MVSCCTIEACLFIRFVQLNRFITLVFVGAMIFSSANAMAIGRNDVFTTATAAQIEDVFLNISDSKTLDSAHAQLNELRDYVIAHAGLGQFDAIVQVEGAAGIISTMSLASGTASFKNISNTSELFLAHRAVHARTGPTDQ